MKRGIRMLDVGALAVLAVVLGIVFWPVRTHSGPPSSAYNCVTNLSQLSLALIMYSHDDGERLPPVGFHERPTKGKAFGWADSLAIYAKSSKIFRCPSVSVARTGDVRQSNYTDYFFNSNLAAQPLKKIDEAALTITFAEGNDGRDKSDARYNRASVPAAWFTNESSPLHRHSDGANYAFADGHVKFVRSGVLKSGRYFFTLKRGR